MKYLSCYFRPSIVTRIGFIMASKSKKIKLSENNTAQTDGLLDRVKNNRLCCASSVKDFKFNKKRVEIVSHELEMPEKNSGVIYWMLRDCRVQDNWAMLFAQKLALKAEVPLHVCYCLHLDDLESTLRHIHFLLKGLEEVQRECLENNVTFHIFEDTPGNALPPWVKKHEIGAVVCDFSPLRVPVSWVEDVKSKLPKNVPFIRVDAHNIVPCLVASDKLEYSARTIRNKINSKLDEFLTEFPPVIKHPHSSKINSEKIDWSKLMDKHCTDKSIGPCSWAVPGIASGFKMLESFCNIRLRKFSEKRNDPLGDALSNLSPWFHFGHLAVQRAVLCVKEYKTKYSDSVAAFCEEAIVRRELCDNFCYYNEHYDSLIGASNWAQTTLNDHRKDKREYVYTRQQLAESLTHDDLWNSAQIQLVKEGKIHGFMRMYWAKKILEWTPNPETALADALFFNDKYSLDGRDPNGFVGCMWSICGIHDQGWAERAVFGKIRYMNYAGCKRKFDINAFIARYGGKCHKYVKK